MTGSPGEMPFLDHLEELRWRILRSLGAIVVGFGLGLWLVQQFQLVNLLKQPIAPYLTGAGGKLIVTSPTEPVMIVFKLGFIVGLVLSSPILLWQLWAFLAPALYAREKRALVPALFVGLLLFLTGAGLAYALVVPQALKVLFSFQTEAIQPFITYDNYFSFVLQVVLALGLSFELPLVIIILAWLEVIGPAELARFRRYAVVAAFAAGALLSPGADVVSMVMMTIPLLLLYEVGYAGSVVITRRRRRAAAIAGLVVIGLGLGGSPVQAQVPQRRPPAQATRQDSLRRDSLQDTTRKKPGQALDSATAGRLGIPTAPSRGFAADDSVLKALKARPGYQSTRYRADSATVFIEDERVLLQGQALTERQGALLEADTIRYQSDSCMLDASGSPHLFDRGQVLVGEGIRYDTCRRRGIVDDALTNFTEGSTVWFLRGNVAQDSSSSRIYAGSSEITSCDLPTPHYQFHARAVKWVSKNVLVARPVVLYVRDVPILWLPFIFQDVRPGRRSGILVPQIGLNDLVRPTRGYNRQVTNVGYYWAPNDYIDVTARLDWFANRYVQYGVSGQYSWLNRFMDGNVGVNEQRQVGGGSGLTFRWDHRQRFSLSSTLNFNINYASNTAVIRGNAIDPLQNTQQITSSLNYSKRLSWATLTLGGNRRQSLTDGSVQQLLPALTLSPVPIAIGSDITWSPGLSFTNNTTKSPGRDTLLTILPGGALDTLPFDESSRVTALSFDTPIRIGGFNWQNSLQVNDQQDKGAAGDSFLTDDPSTADPTDSVRVRRSFLSNFQTSIDWDTGINLPVLFRGSWKIQPVVGVGNTTSGPFAIRNRNTNGAFVQQGKRFRFGATASPTLFAFFPGIGPLSRIRHSLSPVVTWNYQPAADVNEEFARAIAADGRPVELRSDAQQRVSVGLSQVFEGKLRPRGADTTGADTRKLRILSINTSAITYDFEQAKKPGFTGWATQTLTNSVLSDLLPGFNLSLTHDLWRGRVGADTADFDPFLQNVSASFALSGNTFRSIGSIFGLGGKRSDDKAERGRDRVPTSYVAESGRRTRPGSFFSSTQAPFRSSGRSFSANFNYQLTRTRPNPAALAGTTSGDVQSLGFSTNFSPTPFWSLSWSSQYNITDGEFESQVVRLERELHEWRAGFNFVRNPNGNFAFYFSIYLTDLPELKFDYDQTTIDQ
ncbi:MAG TPA: twin-arginine translocase subunit TatC [Gemmatimonadales bacterium]|nr:twin-arginine translocase subunit TatC [Gemmatimonadales bacterium]